MLNYQTLDSQIRRIVLSTMKDGDKAFNLPKVIEALSHNLNDRRYVAYALAGVCNGYGDIDALSEWYDVYEDYLLATLDIIAYYEDMGIKFVY